MPDGSESGFEVVLNCSRADTSLLSLGQSLSESQRLWQTDMESAEGERETLERLEGLR